MSTSSSEHSPGDLVRLLTTIFVVAVLVNYPWERLQSPLYVYPGGASIHWWLCLAASLADGLFVLVIFGVGWMTMGRRTWFKQPGIKGYLVMLVSGVTIGVGVEYDVVSICRWPQTTREHADIMQANREGNFRNCFSSVHCPENEGAASSNATI